MMEYYYKIVWLLLIVPLTSASYKEPPNLTPSLSPSQSGPKCTVCSTCTLPFSSSATATATANAGRPHTYESDTRLSYPASPWIVVTCDGSGSGSAQQCSSSQNILDLRTCGHNKARSEKFWSSVSTEIIACEDSIVSSVTALADLEIECISSSSSSSQRVKKRRNAQFTASVRIDNEGKLRCPQISAMDSEDVEPQEQMAPPADNVVVRAVLPNNKTATTTTSTTPQLLSATTSSHPNSTVVPTEATAMAMTSTIEKAPALSCTAVPDRAFRPAGHNSSVCDDVFVDTKTSGTAARLCGILFKELLFGLAVYILMVMLGFI